MMTVEELFHRLSYGELVNLSMSTDGNGTILEEKQPSIIIAANEALLRLYSRFVLKESEVIIGMVDHITQYHLSVEFTESQGDPDEERYLYIKDLHNEHFTGDVIKVMRVFDSLGAELKLNDAEAVWSVFTPKPKTLQVPIPLDGQSLSVVYQAKHATLVDDDLEQLIDVPEVLEGALTSYIAGKIYSNMNGVENIAKSQEQFAVYDSICSDAIDRDLVNTSISSTNTKFYKRGFI